MTRFTDELQARIAAKYSSRKRFIAAAEPDRGTDKCGGYLSCVLRGTRPPPMHRLGGWARALGLEGEAAEHFFDLALVAHLPTEFQPRFESLLGRVRWCEDRLRELSQELEDARAELARRARRVADGD